MRECSVSEAADQGLDRLLIMIISYSCSRNLGWSEKDWISYIKTIIDAVTTGFISKISAFFVVVNKYFRHDACEKRKE